MVISVVRRHIIHVVEEPQIKLNLSMPGLLAEQAGMKDPGCLFCFQNSIMHLTELTEEKSRNLLPSGGVKF